MGDETGDSSASTPETNDTYQQMDTPYTAAVPMRKKPRNEELSESDKALAAITARLTSSREEDEWDLVGKNVACKLRKVSPRMQPIAEKLINDVLFLAQTSKLDESMQIFKSL